MSTATQEALGDESWESSGVGKIGRSVSVEVGHGVRAQQEMIDLIAALERAGVICYIVSASAEPVVRAAAEYLGYSGEFGVNREHVYGVRVETNAQGRFTTEDAKNYPLTYRMGKVKVIESFIGVEPLLVAGDTYTDYEMLTSFDDTEVLVVINRNKGGPMKFLYRIARQSQDVRPGGGRVRVLLQGRDERVGQFRPSLDTPSKPSS